MEASRPEALESASLEEALRDLTQRWSALNGINAAFITTGDSLPLHPDIQVALLRTAQEALVNAAKHAGATRVRLTLSYMRDVVTLDVRDDGIGFEAPAGDDASRPSETGSGFGLTAMRQRLQPAGRHARDRVRAGRRDGDLGASAGDRPPGRRTSDVTTAHPTPIRLLIVDDHPVVRDGLRGMFAGDPLFDVIGEAGDGDEAVSLAEALRPDVVLMDLRMPGVDGATAIRRPGDLGNPARVLVLTIYDSAADVVPALEAGATGYLLKDTPREELRRAVRAAHRGESELAPSVTTRLVGQLRNPVHPRDALSDRELEVLSLIANGETNRGVAARLFVSEATVKTHLLHIYAKLDVNDRAAAVAKAFERGLLGSNRS